MAAKHILRDLDITLEYFTLNKAFKNNRELIKDIFEHRGKLRSGNKNFNVAGDLPEPEINYFAAIIKTLKESKYIFDLRQGEYILLIKGYIFLESPPWPFTRRPHAYNNFKKNLQVWWNLAKVIAIALNGLALLYLGWMEATKSR